MDKNETETIDSTKDTQQIEKEEIVIEEEEVEEDMDSLPEWAKKKIQTAEAQKKHWKDKATKVVEKSVEKTESTEIKSDLNSRDLYALMNAKVHEDDINDVVEYARFKKISVSEALKSPVVKNLISQNEEHRNVSNAANTNTVKRSSSKLSGDALVERASRGELPESEEDILAFNKARKGLK